MHNNDLLEISKRKLVDFWGDNPYEQLWHLYLGERDLSILLI